MDTWPDSPAGITRGTRAAREEITVNHKIEVGVLGATGTVGQQLVTLLSNHPWFRLTWLDASERSAGKRYGDLPRSLPGPLPDEVARIPAETPQPGRGPRLLFSALEAAVAGELEASLSAAGHIVVSNARNHRMNPLVPLLVPEINPEHLGLLPLQRKAKGWQGSIVTNPNCSTVFLAMALAALREFHPVCTSTQLWMCLGGGFGDS